MWKVDHLFTADQKVNLCSDRGNQDRGAQKMETDTVISLLGVYLRSLSQETPEILVHP